MWILFKASSLSSFIFNSLKFKVKLAPLSLIFVISRFFKRLSLSSRVLKVWFGIEVNWIFWLLKLSLSNKYSQSDVKL